MSSHAFGEQNEGAIELHWDEFEPEGEVVARNPTMIHIEQMDDGLWWLRIDQSDGISLIGHFRSKKPIHAMWEWE